MNPLALMEPEVSSAFYGRFPELRPAQKAAIEPLLSGRNVILTSGTGSGKTEAVVAPLVSRFWRQVVNRSTLFLLYVAPTKALVNDLEKRLYPPLTGLGLRLGVRHGDRDDLRNGMPPHVLITTPESLDVLLFRREPALQSVSAVVVDEVHLLYNTQRGLQLSILLRRLCQVVGNQCQWAALSATVGDLSHVRDFLVGSEQNADLLAFSSERAIDAQIRYTRSMADFVGLVHRLTEGRSTKLLVFADSRRECERLAGALQQHPSLQHFVFAHYSSLSSELRVDTEQKFASMGTAICIATSTLELGIDIGDIDAVLLWGVPSGVDSFLQRIGRGNRRSSKTNVVCLVPDTSASVAIDALRFAVLVDAARKGELPVREPYELFGAVGQQCLSIIASHGGGFTKVADLCALLEHKKYLSRGIMESILAELCAAGFLQRHGYKNRCGADEELHRLIDMKLIYGNFGVSSQTVDLYHGSKRLGEVPAVNLLRIRGGMCVRFAGNCWRVKKARIEGIHLVPSGPNEQVVDFSYGGSGAPSNPYISSGVWHMIHENSLDLNLFERDLRQRVEHFRNQVRRMSSEDRILYSRSADGIRYFTFAGSVINRAVGLYAQKPGFKADDRSLLVPSPIDWASIPTSPTAYEGVFHLLFEGSGEQSLYQQQLPFDLQEREYLQDWLKDTAVPRILARLNRGETREIDGETAASLA